MKVTFMDIRYLVILLLIVALLPACQSSAPDVSVTEVDAEPQITPDLGALYLFSPTQEMALQKLLAQNPAWRLAMPRDNQSDLYVQYEQENPGYDPYFAHADMTGDGLDDFAVALVQDAQWAVV